MDSGDDDPMSHVPETLWSAGFRHPEVVFNAMTTATLAELIKQPLPVASRILTVCGKYSGERCCLCSYSARLNVTSGS